MAVLKVDDITHKKIKLQAIKHGMTIKEYLKYLADKQEKNDKA